MHKVLVELLRKGKVTGQVAKLILSWRHCGFNVHSGSRIQPRDEEAMENLARYIVRASFTQETEEELKTGVLVPPKPPRIAVTGTVGELQEYFSDPILSDGLPVVVPTEERVAEMLKGTSHAPDEILGKQRGMRAVPPVEPEPCF